MIIENEDIKNSRFLTFHETQYILIL